MKASGAAIAKGDYATAAGQAEEAARLFERAGDLSNQSKAVNHIGLSWIYRGEYDRALQSYRKALDLDRRSGDVDELVATLNNIGSIYFFLGRYYEALDNYQLAMAEVQSHVGQSWSERRLALTSANLAVLYEQVGQNHKALEYFKQALQKARALPPDEYGQLLSNSGTLYRRLGDPRMAVGSYLKARKVFARTRHADAEIHVLENMGIVMALDLRDDGAAAETFTQALELAKQSTNKRQALLAHIFRGEAYFRMGKTPEAAQDFGAALEQANTLGAAEERWTALFNLGRLDQRAGDFEGALNQYQQAISVIESLRSDLRESSLRSEFLANKRDVYNAAIDLLLSSPSIDKERVFELVEHARERRLQDALRSKERLTIQAVQSRLRDRDVLLEYWLDANKVALIRLTKSKAEIGVRPLSESEEERIQQYVIALQDHSLQRWRKESKAISGLLFLGKPVDKGSHVFVVPDGLLAEVPFETLVNGKGLLVERSDVNYLPAASVLKPPAQGEPSFPEIGRRVLFGDPLTPSADNEFGNTAWTRLQHSREEVTGIAKLLGKSSRMYLEEADLKQSFISEAQRSPQVIHLSTHAAVDLRNPERSRILFSPDRRQAASQYLFLKEASGLKLKKTDLVTVSACDTERGTLTPGEGLQSFSRAFLGAGAAATITTLWRVEDARTAQFMKRFYFHLAKGSGKATALRQAKLDSLRSGADSAEPRYWAAFVLNGEGRNALFARPKLPWQVLVLASVGVLALSGSAIGIRKRLRSKGSGRNG